MKINNINSTNNISPLQYYNLVCSQQKFTNDVNQEQAIIILDKLWRDLVTLKAKRNRFLCINLFSPKIPKGVYIWGEVGRGKSFLMDIFYNCLPFKYKRRVHFHEFMDNVNLRLEKLRHKDNPIDIISLELSKELKVLCFDEFHVSDIADAMILGNLLFSLIKNGIVILMTSNYEPRELYTHGLNRSSFLPTIDFIYEKFEIIKLEGEIDYRRSNSLMDLVVFYIPNSQENNEKFKKLFNKITSGKQPKSNIIEILHRHISTIEHFERVIWFDFHTLCCTNRSQQDYLFLARNYLYIFISDVTKLSSSDSDIARRFTWLVDILYDFKVKLCLTSSCKLEDIYIKGDFSQEFIRTTSRLIEMQSKNYLMAPHILL